MPGMREFGRVKGSELKRVLVLSPHLDDAVLGVGQFMAAHAGVTVATLMAGIPPSYSDPPTSWDREGGFKAGDDVVTARRVEDQRALAHLGAKPIWLDALDWQYRPGLKPEPMKFLVSEVARAVAQAKPTAVFVPLGLAHPDHVQTHQAALRVRTDVSAVPSRAISWFAYTDMGYHLIPGVLADRLSRLARSRIQASPVALPVDPSIKRKKRAMAKYTSQAKALAKDWDLHTLLDTPLFEGYWRLSDIPRQQQWKPGAPK